MNLSSLLVLLPLAACATSTTASRALVTVDLANPSCLEAFEFTDPEAWRLFDDGGPSLDLHRASDYRPPHRSPLGLALLKRVDVGDFALDLEAKQTGREYSHRDLVFVFGYRDPAHFCYAHLASAADDSAHHLQVVDGADRRPVTTGRSEGVAWGDGWHKVRVERRGTRVQVFFDGGADPVLMGDVPAWRGRIGLGSFDDTGRFRGITLSVWDGEVR